LINGNAVILVSLLIVAAFAALRAGRDELAGILLAISTIKPHLVLLPIIFILIWTISLRRWRTLGWMLISIFLLSVAAALLVPDWPLQNLREILAYSSYNPPGTPGAVFEVWLPATGRQLGWALSVVLGLILFTEWVLVRGKEFRWFLWTGSLTLVISQWIGIQTDPGNFILLYFPLVLVFSLWIERWTRSGRYLVIIAMALLFIGPWVLFLETVAYGDQPLQHPVMFFPLPLFLLITLYWVRWWGIKPRSLLVDRLREYEQQV
jgi:cell division protein FtsW (lipid II flippase)